MRLNPIIDISTGRPCIKLEHKGEELLWDIKVYSNMLPKGGEKKDVTFVVKHINHYWSLLSENRQDKIFQLYVQARAMIDEVADDKRLRAQLRDVTRQLYIQHPLAEMEEYVKKSAKIKLPEDLKEVHGIDAPNTPQTYLNHEYVGLLILAVQLRVLLPVWGEYVNRIAPEVGSRLKELHVSKIITTSRLMDCPYYNRYKLYVETFVGDQGSQAALAVVLNHMGTSVIPEYMTAIAMVRRLTCCELIDWTSPQEPTHVISMIYNYIKSKSDQSPKTFSNGQMIKEKLPENGTQNDDPDNTSRAEGFKIREPISAATLMQYTVYMKRVDQIIKTIAPDIPDDVLRNLVSQYGNVVLNSRTYDPLSCQLVLVQWVLRFVVPARSIPHLDYEAVMNSVIATAVILTHWGYHDLALLLVSDWKMIPESTIVGTRRANVTKEQAEKLSVMYPHYQMPKLKRDQRVDDANLAAQLKQNIANNIAIKEIDELAKELSGYEWTFHKTLSSVAHSTMYRGANGFSIPDNIKPQMADLVILLANKRKEIRQTELLNKGENHAGI